MDPSLLTKLGGEEDHYVWYPVVINNLLASPTDLSGVSLNKEALVRNRAGKNISYDTKPKAKAHWM